MKQHLRLIPIALLAILATSCIGSRTRDNVLLPAMDNAWAAGSQTGVEADCLRGVELALRDGELDPTDAGGYRTDIQAIGEALSSRDRSALTSTNWTGLLAQAEYGVHARVAAGELHPKAGDSLLERIHNFDDSFRQATSR